MIFPIREDIQRGAAITMWFCFRRYEILFINSKLTVIDKIILNPWRTAYIPKAPCKYVIESLPNTFEMINIGDKIDIKFEEEIEEKL